MLLRSFLDDFESDIDVCNVNNVDSGDPVIVHICCLCEFFCRDSKNMTGWRPVRTSFVLFILGYFIIMHYGHIASGKRASICERSLLSFVIRVLILHTKRTRQSVI